MGVFRISKLIIEEQVAGIINNNSPPSDSCDRSRSKHSFATHPLSILRLVRFDTLISRPFHGNSFEYKSGCLHTLWESQERRTRRRMRNQEDRDKLNEERTKKETKRRILFSLHIVTANHGARPCRIFFIRLISGSPARLTYIYIFFFSSSWYSRANEIYEHVLWTFFAIIIILSEDHYVHIVNVKYVLTRCIANLETTKKLYVYFSYYAMRKYN